MEDRTSTQLRDQTAMLVLAELAGMENAPSPTVAAKLAYEYAYALLRERDTYYDA
jgi:hypothetical protein